jgi:photosystem II stability/assembly factor-like uncharacterized protein
LYYQSILTIVNINKNPIMALKRFITCSIFLILVNISVAQQIQLIETGTKSSLRGLSVVNDRVIWASGSGGTVGKSLDSGKTWVWQTVKGFEKAEFRDIEAFDETSAVIISIAEPAYILRTSDGGTTWKTVYENKTKGMFLDAMEFWNEQSGILVGDPIDNKIFVARTFDGGFTWQEILGNNLPIVDSGEAMFASSGTNVRKLNNASAVFVTGGLKSNIFIQDKKINLPIIQGKESTGANSIAVKNTKTMIVVGGDFNAKNDSTLNCVVTFDGGKNWIIPQQPPHGYRSCVEYVTKKTWVTCGLNGVDISTNDGNNWKQISSTSFHACRKAKKGMLVFFSGGNGRMGKLLL